jgi:hypothetical protein
MISTTEYREPDVQTIYLGLPTRLHGSENRIFVQALAMNTENYYVDYLDSSIKNHYFRGHHSPCSICLVESNRRVDLNRANNGQRYIPERGTWI